MATTNEETPEEKKARITAANEARRKAALDEQTRFGDLTEELEDRFSTELNGLIGREFTIVASAEGPIVLRRTESVYFKTFNAAAAEKNGPSEMACSKYVTPALLYPDRDTATERFARLPGLLITCANELTRLHQGRVVDLQGK